MASLAWSASTDSRVSGYRVYYGTSSGNYLQAKGAGIVTGNITSFTVNNLPAGRLYYFAVTSVDSLANESGFSNEVTKLVP